MSNETVEIVVIYGPDGSIQGGIAGGTTFELAASTLNDFMDFLQADSPTLTREGEVERHSHPEEGLKVRSGQRYESR